MNVSDITFIFTVGGNQCHYDNMERCIGSINRHYHGAKLLILEFGSKLSTTNDREVLNLNDLINWKDYIYFNEVYLQAERGILLNKRFNYD